MSEKQSTEGTESTAEDKESTAEDKAAETKKAKREQLYTSVKGAIEGAGPEGITAKAIAVELGILTGDAEKDKDVLHEMRAVARAVCKKEGWSRMNRDGRNKLYQAIPEAEAKVQFDADAKAKADAKAEKRAAAKKAAEEADDDEDDEDVDMEDEDVDEDDED